MIDLFDNSKFKTFVLEEKHKINAELANYWWIGKHKNKLKNTKLMMNWQTIDELAN